MDIPPAVITALQAVTASDLYPVSGTESYSLPILKTRILQFDSGAVLRLARLDVPFIIICAQQILLRGPAPRATITRDTGVVAKTGAAGAPGARGVAGERQGMAGANATGGSPGAPGQSAQLPPLYLFMEEMVAHPKAPVEWLDFWLLMAGIDGGAGGAGGYGGDGGPGAAGSPGKDGVFGCDARPGDGGAGGAGGAGSAGGAGGNGSDGGQLIYVGPDAALDQMSWIKVVNTGGAAGQGGARGRGGAGGHGGPPGANTAYCPPGRNGFSGQNGIDGIDGASGQPGNKGSVSLVARVSLDDLYA